MPIGTPGRKRFRCLLIATTLLGGGYFLSLILSDGLSGGLSDAMYNKSHPYYKSGFGYSEDWPGNTAIPAHSMIIISF